MRGLMKASRKCEAWFGLLRSAKDMATSQSADFESILDEFSDVFEAPGVPQERDIKHRIDLADENA